jgi:hypothetical protein
MNAEFIPTSLTVLEIKALRTPKLRLLGGMIVDGSFEVIGENNQGKQVVIEYIEPAPPGRIIMQGKPGMQPHRPQSPVTRSELEQWQKDHNFIFPFHGKG